MKFEVSTVAAGLLWLSMLVQAQDLQAVLAQLPSCAVSIFSREYKHTNRKLANLPCAICTTNGMLTHQCDMLVLE